MSTVKIQDFRSALSPITATGSLRWGLASAYYLLANLFHLGLGNALFYDDWDFYEPVNLYPEKWRACAVDVCKFPLLPFESEVVQIGVFGHRLLTILAIWISGVTFWKILRATRCLREWELSMATVLFLVMPILGARVSIANTRIMLMLMLFLIGCFLVTKHHIVGPAIGVLLLGTAPVHPSFQFFLVIPVVLLVICDANGAGRISRKTLVIATILLSFALVHRYVIPDFWIRTGLLAPEVGYNSIGLNSLSRAVLVCGALAAPMLVDIARHLQSGARSLKFRTSLFKVGLSVLAVGTLPYMMVGHFANFSDWITPFLPDNSEWDSRHQLLQGFGYALVVPGLLGSLVEGARARAFSVILLTCLGLSMSMFGNYYVDALKQRDVMSGLRDSAVALEHPVRLQFVDDAVSLNARGRVVRTYEWQGMAERAIGSEVLVVRNQDHAVDCVGARAGTRVTIRQISGRLRGLISRTPVVNLEFTDLVECQ